MEALVILRKGITSFINSRNRRFDCRFTAYFRDLSGCVCVTGDARRKPAGGTRNSNPDVQTTLNEPTGIPDKSAYLYVAFRVKSPGAYVCPRVHTAVFDVYTCVTYDYRRTCLFANPVNYTLALRRSGFSSVKISATDRSASNRVNLYEPAQRYSRVHGIAQQFFKFFFFCAKSCHSAAR